MADNAELNLGSGGVTLAGASLSISGDTAFVQMFGIGILSGSEGSWVHTQIVGGAGAVGAGVQRVTLANDDTLTAAANALLTTIDTDTSAMVVDLAAIEVLITAGNVDLAALEVLVTAGNVDLAAIEVLITAGNADLALIKTATQLIDDAVYVDDATWTDDTSKNMLVGGIYQSTSQTITDGSVGPIQVSSDGHVIIHAIDSKGNDLEFAKENDNWSAADHGVILFARDEISTPDKYRAIRSDASGNLLVVNSGTFVVQEDGAALTALQLIDDVVFADNAPFTLTTSKVMAAGAIRDDTLGTLSAVEGDAVPLRVGSTGALHVTGAGGGTQYTLGTDTYTETTSIGTIAGAVRFDAGGTLVNTDNEIAPLQVDANGALRVAGGGGGTEYTEDAAAAANPVGSAMIVVREDARAGSLTTADNDNVALRGNNSGELYTLDTDANALLTTIDADTSVLAGTVAAAAAALPAAFVVVAADNGSTTQPLQTDVSGYLKTVVETALPAGTNAIGKLAANSGVDIGDVDVLSVVPGVAATNLGKARASALGATDTGVMPLAVRNDDLADLAGADGDYTPLQVDNAGSLYTNAAAAENKSASGVAAGGAPGTDDMIAAVAGKKLLITAMSLTATSVTTNSVFVDNVDNDLWANTANPIPLSLDADGDTLAGIVLPYNPAGWFKTDAVNEAVTLNSSAAQDIAWSISYIETD